MTEQEKRIEKAAKQHALTLVDEHEGTPQFICFKAGVQWALEFELSSLRSELAEKEKENSELKEFGASIHVSNELAHYKALCEAADKVIQRRIHKKPTNPD